MPFPPAHYFWLRDLHQQEVVSLRKEGLQRQVGREASSVQNTQMRSLFGQVEPELPQLGDHNSVKPSLPKPPFLPRCKDLFQNGFGRP